MTFEEKESFGMGYMMLALKYGSVGLQTGLILCSGKYLNGLGMIDPETGASSDLEEEKFYFHKKTGGGGVITECYYPAHVIECMEYEKQMDEEVEEVMAFFATLIKQQ